MYGESATYFLNFKNIPVQVYTTPSETKSNILYGIWIIQSGETVFILNLDKILLKKLFPTMNIYMARFYIIFIGVFG